MSERGLYAIGHITEDVEARVLPDGSISADSDPHLGGAVSYTAVTARRLGMYANIITEAPADHAYVAQLKAADVDVTCLDEVTTGLTTFRNTYDETGRRQQTVPNMQDKIDLSDIEHFPNFSDNPVILVAPVIGEVDTNLFPKLAAAGYLVVTPQGYFRHRHDNGHIERKPWPEIDSLGQAQLVILSHEDLTFDDAMDSQTLERIKSLSPIVVLTEGSNGLTVFKQDEEPVHINRFELKPDEIKSPTGAGDSCAGAFIWHFLKWEDLKEAAAFGAFYPALKLLGIGDEQRGVGALPTLEQVRQYMADNSVRVKTFLDNNGLRELRL